MAKSFGIFVGLFLCVAFVSCGGNSKQYSGVAGFINTPGNPSDAGSLPDKEIVFRSVSLQEALSDLEALPVPSEVDTELFETMRDELEAALMGYYSGDGATQLWMKVASAIDPPSINGAWCLTGNITPTGLVTINWRGNHLGDYDLNSEVNVADITPLVIHYLANPVVDETGLPVVDASNEASAQADGDNNGEVNIADITQIALNFASSVVGFRLYRGTTTDGIAFDWDDDYVQNMDDPGAPVTVPFNTSLEAGEILRYSASFDYTPTPGEKLYVRVVPFDGTLEGPEQIIPVPEGPHAMFDCSQCHNIVDMEFVGVETSCLTCHAVPPEDHETSWEDTPGVHSSCMMCHNEHGFIVEPAELVCSNCHGSIASEVAGSGMTACLTCHSNAHLPDAKPSTAKCAECHSTQAEEIAAGSMTDCYMCHSQHSFSINYTKATCIECHPAPPDVDSGDWANAPGLHSQCESCHNKHSFAIAEPNSVCANCHQARIDAGHLIDGMECLDCHVSPHIPDTIVPGTACVYCHTSPPENPEALWEDTNASHRNCTQCHSEPQHGNKPTPAESVCGNCHGDPVSAEHTPANPVCLDCHTYPHLPEIQFTGDDCDGCHDDYIPAAGHTDGHTVPCASCHPSDHTVASPWSRCWDCHVM